MAMQLHIRLVATFGDRWVGGIVTRTGATTSQLHNNVALEGLTANQYVKTCQDEIPVKARASS